MFSKQRILCLAVVSAMACGGTSAEPITINSATNTDAGSSHDSGGNTTNNSTLWASLSEPDVEQLEARLALAPNDLGIPGAALAVARVDKTALWAGTTGFVDPETSELWGENRQFRVGSVTKTFTTAALLLLVAEGRVGLDDPVDDWIPGYFDRSVLVRHLASNTSGIASYNYVGSFDESREWEPLELVEWAMTHEPELLFEPGTRWDYSNTNFVLMGLIIEAASGESYSAFVESRLLEPLGLEDTYVAGADDQNYRVVRAFGADGSDLTYAADPSFAFAAGAIVSTPADLVRWAAALYGGDVLEEEHLDLMTTPVIMADEESAYGFGTFVEGSGDETTIGHTGGIGGYLTYMYFLPSESAVVVAMTNVRGADVQRLAAYGWSVVLGVSFP